MTDLTREQRRALETSIKAAREEAEIAAAEALRGLRVPDAEAPAGSDPERRAQRNRLRAHARALDDKRAANGAQAITRLTEQAAYVQWHRLLFARFLVERGLLRDETGALVSLTDCREIALDLSADEDAWSVASGFAAGMLPGVFPADDPVESLRLTRERGRELRNRLLSIDAAVFQADDSLGWTYQFWRAAEKKAVNESQVKIGAAELPAVTQLFTEPYMVRFLLHNTLGAWWAGKVLAGNTALARESADEAALRKACALPGHTWDFLRFVQEDGVWRPAAGTFPGWPTTAKALTVLDPCCGSGHFLTEALTALTALRVAEESLSPADAVAAVLRENLAGLEIDGRCVQIAAFALTLTAWRIGGPGVLLPTPNVAWVGARPPLPKAEFVALANGDVELRRGLEALHDLFIQAPLLGSLIEPVGGDLADPRRVARIDDSIDALMDRMRGAEPERREGVISARGMVDAVAALTRHHNLIATNPPFIGLEKLSVEISEVLSEQFPLSKRDLSTIFLERMLRLNAKSATVAMVLPSEWTYSRPARHFREHLRKFLRIQMVARIGRKAFQTNLRVNPILFVAGSGGNVGPKSDQNFLTIDVRSQLQPDANACLSENSLVNHSIADARFENDFRFMVSDTENTSTLGEFGSAKMGMSAGDGESFERCFWEILNRKPHWEFLQSSAAGGSPHTGRSLIIHWEDELGRIVALAESVKHLNHAAQNWQRGRPFWGYKGIVINKFGGFSLYEGDRFDSRCMVYVPRKKEHLLPIFVFFSRGGFEAALKLLDDSLALGSPATVEAVPIEISEWEEIARREFPAGVPEPYSDDPTQWLFHGHPRQAAPGTELHVALARLAGYRWPAETDATMALSAAARVLIEEGASLPAADADGLLPLTPLLGERALADRLRAFCVKAWGADWQPGTEAALVGAACDLAKDKRPAALTLEAWLRTHAARQHAKLFHDRPFLWWITDGRADGFCAIVHYHRLTKDKLERLAFHMLGDHLTRLGDDPRAEAGTILQRKLARIIEGEAPFDIFARWKPLHAQPMGWEPDLDDGVRLNIRPFIEAGVLAHVPNGIHYRTDRGKDVASAPWYGIFGGERRNDHHTTLAEKREARAKAKR